MRYLVFIFLLYPLHLAGAAKLDKEARESLKCARYFKYFEKKYDIPRDTLYSISLQETGRAHSARNIRMVWPWTVNVEGKSVYLDSRSEAVKYAIEQYKNNKSIDVGCMQINLNYHGDGFKTMRHAFNPKHNVAYAAKFLRKHYDKTGDWHKAISLYHSATPHLGEQYRQKVLAIADKVDLYKTLYTSPSRSSVKANKKTVYWKARQHKGRKKHIRLSAQSSPQTGKYSNRS